MINSTSTSLRSPALPARLALLFSTRHRSGRHAKQNRLATGIAVTGCALGATATAGAVALAIGSAATPTATAAVVGTAPIAHIDNQIDGSASRVPLVVNDGKPVVAALPAASSGSILGGASVTFTGANLTQVASATVGGQPAAIATASDDAVTITVPAAGGYAEGTQPVQLLDAAGSPVAVDLTPATTTVAGLAEPAAVPAPQLTFTYTADAGIQAQIAYIMAHWSDYNDDYTAISGRDCVNFTSQALIARGWTMDAEWLYRAGVGSSAWTSSTAFHSYLAAHPERATPVDRDGVKVGDIAQFDWNNSGDWDHTATVTRVENTAAGIRIWVGGHTKDIDYWDVEAALASQGGRVAFWSVA